MIKYNFDYVNFAYIMSVFNGVYDLSICNYV